MTCAKQKVTCKIEGRYGFVVGENWCKTPQTSCPREQGEDYTKCKTICGQFGHAEVSAIARAQEIGLDIEGGTATLEGHYYFCEPCARALKEAGIAKLEVILWK